MHGRHGRRFPSLRHKRADGLDRVSALLLGDDLPSNRSTATYRSTPPDQLKLKLQIQSGGNPHLAKNERDAPNFLHAALDETAYAPFFNEEAHEVRGTHHASQEIGGVGHPGVVAGKIRESGQFLIASECHDKFGFSEGS